MASVIVWCGLTDVIVRCGLTGVIVRCGLTGVIVRCGLVGVIVRCGLTGVIVRCGLTGMIVRCGLVGVIVRCGLAGVIVRCGLAGVIVRCGLAGVIKRCVNVLQPVPPPRQPVENPTVIPTGEHFAWDSVVHMCLCQFHHKMAYLLCCILQKFPQDCPQNSNNVSVAIHRLLSSMEDEMYGFFLCSVLPLVVNAGMLWFVHAEKISLPHQLAHFSSYLPLSPHPSSCCWIQKARRY